VLVQMLEVTIIAINPTDCSALVAVHRPDATGVKGLGHPAPLLRELLIKSKDGTSSFAGDGEYTPLEVAQLGSGWSNRVALTSEQPKVEVCVRPTELSEHHGYFQLAAVMALWVRAPDGAAWEPYSGGAIVPMAKLDTAYWVAAKNDEIRGESGSR
jgi:hypothetical protein